MAQSQNKDLMWWVGGILILGIFLGLFYSIVVYQRPKSTQNSTSDTNAPTTDLDKISTVAVVGSPAPAAIESKTDLDSSLKALDDTPAGDDTELKGLDKELEALQ